MGMRWDSALAIASEEDAAAIAQTLVQRVSFAPAARDVTLVLNQPEGLRYAFLEIHGTTAKSVRLTKALPEVGLALAPYGGNPAAADEVALLSDEPDFTAAVAASTRVGEAFYVYFSDGRASSTFLRLKDARLAEGTVTDHQARHVLRLTDEGCTARELTPDDHYMRALDEPLLGLLGVKASDWSHLSLLYARGSRRVTQFGLMRDGVLLDPPEMSRW